MKVCVKRSNVAKNKSKYAKFRLTQIRSEVNWQPKLKFGWFVASSSPFMACRIQRVLCYLRIIVAISWIVFILTVLKHRSLKSKLLSWRQDVKDEDNKAVTTLVSKKNSEQHLITKEKHSLHGNLKVTAKAPINFKLDGGLNVHRWSTICGNSTDSLRKHVLFPQHPMHRTSTSVLKMVSDFGNFGERIFGFIYVPVTGTYQFVISSGGFSELWLSFDEDPNNAKLVCQVDDHSSVTYTNTYSESRVINENLDTTSRNIYLEEGNSNTLINKIMGKLFLKGNWY